MDPFIQAALDRRSPGGSPQPLTGTPTGGQTSAPTAPLPTGGANVPTQPAPQAPMAAGTPNMNPGATPAGQAAVKGATQLGGMPGVDDETKMISKTLISKLLKLM